MNPSRKKELLAAYKQRGMEGGVYCIRCTANDKRLIESTTNLPGAENRFAFAVQMNSPTIGRLEADWHAHGASAFVFEALESLPQKPEETDSEYRDSLALLRDCHRSEYPENTLY